MRSINIKGTRMFFTTILDKEKNIFEISGLSRPENANQYFKPIFDWFEEYFTSPNNETTIKFNLQYYDTATTKNLLRLILLLNSFFEKCINIKIQWQYNNEDEDILDSGKEFASFVKIPFEFIECD